MRNVWIGLLLALPGCVATRQGALVELGLSSVQRPQDVAERWGEYTLAPADSTGYTYEDGLIALAVVPLGGTFSAVVRNKTDHSIRLLWADASYVGPDGLSSGVVPGETRWIDMGNAPAPQTIPSRASAAISIIPKANANTSNQSIEDFYPYESPCSEATGTTVRLLLPIEIQGVTNEYTLQFEPTDVSEATWEMNGLSSGWRLKSKRPCGDTRPVRATLQAPEGARFVASVSRRVVFPIRDGCAAPHQLPATDLMFFTVLEDALAQRFERATDPGCEIG